ncbi:hypothetical protein [Stenotrophomonas sp. PS02289]|uniref:hypothetical protein n=1 Tax=Stenotrophomonas sp. PS02289 TaxID=2991422 RepID=UPI00249BAB05|nr:hypothetical protein [Stenotrophomonas sp. PS02289]
MSEASALNTKLRESLEPKLKLFMSADIVGSTAFKQRTGQEFNQQWFSIVRSFYTLAEQFFEMRWKQAIKEFEDAKCELPIGKEVPQLWKTIGDEVLFTKDIASPHEAMICMGVWLRVLDDLRGLLKKSDSLGLKSAAWLADFPIRNREILLRAWDSDKRMSAMKSDGPELPSDEPAMATDNRVPANGQTAGGDEGAERIGEQPTAELGATPEQARGQAATEEEEDSEWENDRLFADFKNNSPEVSRDFIGQSIDTGFRVSTASSARKLMLSVELAHMLSLECIRVKGQPQRLPKVLVTNFAFHYDGRHSLKGVLDGIPYPLIWLDVEPEKLIHSTEDTLSARPKPTASQVHEFTSALISDFPNRFCTQLEFLVHKPALYEKYEQEISDAIDKLEVRFAKRDASVKVTSESTLVSDDGIPSNTADVNSLFAPVIGRSSVPPPTSP